LSQVRVGESMHAKFLFLDSSIGKPYSKLSLEHSTEDIVDIAAWLKGFFLKLKTYAK
jgi:hypothetical protein